MPWAFWKRQAFSVRAAKKSSESPGSEAPRDGRRRSYQGRQPQSGIGDRWECDAGIGPG